MKKTLSWKVQDFNAYSLKIVESTLEGCHELSVERWGQHL